jgi:hypothetical protein
VLEEPTTAEEGEQRPQSTNTAALSLASARTSTSIGITADFSHQTMVTGQSKFDLLQKRDGKNSWAPLFFS